jgi:hypothetical protein
VPAFDQYFCRCFRITSFNKESLKIIQNFYLKNQTIIDGLSNNIRTKKFINPTQKQFKYPKAKIIVMYGFVVGTQK